MRRADVRRTFKALIAATAMAAARMGNAAEVSADLQQWLESAGDGDRVSVIVRFTEGGAASQVPDLRIVKPFGREFRKLGMASARLSAESVRKVATSANVEAIVLDRTVSVMMTREDAATAAPPYSLIQLGSGASEAARQFGATGAGVGVAVIDSGRAFHEDFSRSVGANFVPVSPTNLTTTVNDRYGHGTVVAGIVAGTGAAARKAGYNFSGIAPGASLVTVRVLDDTGSGRLSDVLAGVNWVLANQARYRIRVVNMSLGMPAVESYRTDPLCLATKKLYQAGIVTVASAGNYGRSPSGEVAYGSITSPGNSPWVVTVGAVNDHGTPARSDDTISNYSSRGPTRSWDAASGQYDHLLKPDLVASGNHVIGPEATNNWITTNYPLYHLDEVSGRKQYMFLHGTSMAAPVVSGVVSMMLQVNPALTPAQIKGILVYTAQTVSGVSVFDQGAGQVNADGAVRLAFALRGAPLTNSVPGTVLLAPARMPAPSSTLSGETVPWSRGFVLLPDGETVPSTFVEKGGVLYSDGVLFTEGIMVARGIAFNECIVKAEGVIFAERSKLSTTRVISAGQLPRLDAQGYVDATAVIFAEGASLGNGTLANRAGTAFASGVLYAQGVIFTGRVSASPAGLIFAPQSTLQNEPYFASGILFAETMLPGLFASPNNVLVAGEAFVY